MMDTRHEPLRLVDDALQRAGAELPADWGAKALYLGASGAQNWLTAASEASASACGSAPVLREKRLTALAEVRPHTYVSLGPGDGLHDRYVIEALQQREPDLRYLPVDISGELLTVVLENLADRVDVPAALQCDFEGGFPFLAKALTRFARRPLLFSLLGGTIGNLDRGESHFLAGLRTLLEANDRFLIEFPLAGPAWTAETEPRLQPASYAPSFRKFLYGAGQAADSDSRQEFVRNFEQHVALSLEAGEVPGSKVIVVRDRHSGRRICNRRYDWEATLRWLRRQGWQVHFSAHHLAPLNDSLGMGWAVISA